MTDFRAQLERYGVDYEATMSRFLNNRELYLRCFGMLLEDENMKKLNTALQQQDCRTAFEAAHTLKGVVGNMGLTPLYTAICKIVEPLRAGIQQDYTEDCRAIAAEFEHVRELYDVLKGGDPS